MAENVIPRIAQIQERVANNLKFFRGKLGISQEKLAERAGLHRTQLSAIEKGGNMRLSTLVSLAAALGVDEVDLLAEREELPVALKSGRKRMDEGTVE